MPGRRCAVFACNNSKVSSKKKGEDIIFHNFPKAKDLVSTNIRNEWIRRCRRADKFNADTSQICSIHFASNDYERDLQNELLGLPTKRKLKKAAVPTLHLTLKKEKSEESDETDSLTSRGKRIEVKKRKKIVESLLNNDSEDSSKPIVTSKPIEKRKSITKDQDNKFNEFNSTPPEPFDYKHSSDHSKLVNDYEDLLKKYDALRKECEEFKSVNLKLRHRNKLLLNQINYYRKKYRI